MWRTFFTVGALFCAAGAQAAVPSHKELQCSQEEDHKTNLKANYALRRCNKCEWKDVPLTVVLLYHNECNALRLWSKNWGNLPSDIKSKVRLLVVDDNSELRACNCVDGLKEGMTVLRVEDDLKWNIGGARNLGAYFSCSEYIFMADSDAYLSESLLNALLQVISSGEADKNVVQFNRHRAFIGEETTLIHPGMMLLSREMYWRTKGCDEDLVGKCITPAYAFVVHTLLSSNAVQDITDLLTLCLSIVPNMSKGSIFWTETICFCAQLKQKTMVN